MWTRKELKDKAKVSFRANYWKSVLVALVVVAITIGIGPYWSTAGSASVPSTDVTASQNPENVNVEIKDGQIKVDVDDGDGSNVHVDLDADSEELAEVLHQMSDSDAASHTGFLYGPGMVIVSLSFLLLILVAIAITLAVYVFVLSPLEVGGARFFVRNLNQRAEVKELAFGYDNNYKEVVKTIFLRDLFIILWSLLLIVPGIYKSYEYRMIPYLLADDPTMTKDRAFSESKRLMDGQKWNAFVLDLSFLGWNILSAMTLGILGAFYVGPYQTQTNAALYEKLRYGLPAPTATQPMPASPVASAPYAGAQVQAAPVIVPTSQPPVPPFAAVGAKPATAPDMTIADSPAESFGDQGDVPADNSGDQGDVPAVSSVNPDEQADGPAGREIADGPAVNPDEQAGNPADNSADDSPNA